MSFKAQRMVRGSLVRVVEFFGNALVGLILMPFIIQALGDKNYGLWIFVGTFLGYYGLMDFGLSSAVQRFISKSLGDGDVDETNKIVNTALSIFTAVGILSLIISVLIAYIIPITIKNLTYQDIEMFRKLIIILGINFAIGFPLRIFSGILVANMRYDLSSGVDFAKLVIRTLLIVVCLKKGNGIIALALITSIMDISSYLFKYFLVRFLYTKISLKILYFDKSRLTKLFGYSSYTFVSQLADQLRFNLDNIVIAIFVGLNSITLYSIGSRLIKYFLDFMGSSLGMSLPLFSQYEGAGNYSLIRTRFLFLSKISSFLALLVGSILLIFGRYFILCWVGVKYVEAYSILVILLIPFLFDVMQIPGGDMLYGLSKHRYYAVSNTLEAIANLILSIIFVRMWGIYGVALGTAIPMFIMKVFIQPIYICKAIDLDVRTYYLGLMVPIVGMSSVIVILYWLLIRSLIHANYLNILFYSTILIFFFVFIVYRFGFIKEERELLKNGIKIFKRSFSANGRG